MRTQKTSKCQDLIDFWDFFLNKIHKHLYDTTAATSSSIQCVTRSSCLCSATPSTSQKIPMYSHEQHSLDLTKYLLDVDEKPEPLSAVFFACSRTAQKFCTAVEAHVLFRRIPLTLEPHWNHSPIWKYLIHLGTHFPDSRAYIHIGIK